MLLIDDLSVQGTGNNACALYICKIAKLLWNFINFIRCALYTNCHIGPISLFEKNFMRFIAIAASSQLSKNNVKNNFNCALI